MSKKLYNNGIEQHYYEEGKQPDGYVLGSCIIHQAHNKNKKEQVKHIYYTNGLKSIRVPEGTPCPEGFWRGRVVNYPEESKRIQVEKSLQTKLERYGDPHYNNQQKHDETCLSRYGDPRYVNPEKAKNTCIERYGVDNVSKLSEVKLKISKKHKGKVISLEQRAAQSEYKKSHPLSPEMEAQRKQHEYETKKKNNSFNVSKPEKALYFYYKNIYGDDDVISNYMDRDRYPFRCDIYIKSEDMFIELNGMWTHGECQFSCMNATHLETLQDWIKKASESEFYWNAIKNWIVTDTFKNMCALEHNLNYHVLTYRETTSQYIYSNGVVVNKDILNI